MAYNKNFNNNNRYNGGYNNRNNNYHNKNYNNNYNYNYRPQNDRPADDFAFDATKYKKPDIKIRDMRGKVYTISGNFPKMFAVELVRNIEEINKVTNGDYTQLDKYPELIHLMKDWILSFLNLNVDGVSYTISDVNAGFNDIWCIFDLFNYIVRVVNADAKDANEMAKLQNLQKSNTENMNQ